MQVLVTGGAGFIGSHLADALVAEGHEVRVLDDLSAGRESNVPREAELIVGDVVEEAVVAKASAGAEVVFHEAAHRAVLQSVEDPLATDLANTHGTLTVLKAACDNRVRRVIYASSSSVYGGATQVPTPESAPVTPRSPYAVTKLTGEHYCRVFTELYALETVSLRYFNVYGPRQDPDSPYAAVIPLFLGALLRREAPTVHGDGLQSRDFAYVDDVVALNLAAATAAGTCAGKVYNVAGGASHSLVQLLDLLEAIVGVSPGRVHSEPRAGDVRNSEADLSAARRDFGYEPLVDFETGLRRTVEWFRSSGRRT